jgi:hypothetical protein
MFFLDFWFFLLTQSLGPLTNARDFINDFSRDFSSDFINDFINDVSRDFINDFRLDIRLDITIDFDVGCHPWSIVYWLVNAASGTLPKPRIVIDNLNRVTVNQALPDSHDLGRIRPVAEVHEDATKRL